MKRTARLLKQMSPASSAPCVFGHERETLRMMSNNHDNTAIGTPEKTNFELFQFQSNSSSRVLHLTLNHYYVI